jgi:hypothetical protein
MTPPPGANRIGYNPITAATRILLAGLVDVTLLFSTEINFE